MILITGATGTAGPEMVKAVLDRGERVRVMARNPEKAAALLGDEVEISRGDFTDEQSMVAAMEDVERALLLCPPALEQAAMESRFIAAAKKAGVKHVVKLSVSAVDAKSDKLFLRSHGIVEEELKASGLAWTMLRPSFFMQNLLVMAPMVKGGALYLPTGAGKGAFVDVRDLAAVAAAALSEKGHEGKAYEITGPQALSYGEIAEILTRVLGKSVKHVDVPMEASKEAMLKIGLEPWRADAVNQLYQGQKDGIFSRVSNAVREVAKNEPTRMEQFVTEHRSAFT